MPLLPPLDLSLLLHLTQHPLSDSKRLQPRRHAAINTNPRQQISLPLTPHSKQDARKQMGETNVACNKASLISNSLTPFLTAPRTCVPSSVHLPSAVSMPRFRMLRVLSSSPGRVHTVPQAASWEFWRQQSFVDLVSPFLSALFFFQNKKS